MYWFSEFGLYVDIIEDLRAKGQLSIGGNEIKLENIEPKGKSPFTKPILCDTDIAVSFNARETHHDKEYVDFIEKEYKDGYIRQDKGNKIILKYKVTSENTKLKDIGKYRRYLYDRRLPGLLIWKYPPNTGKGIRIEYAEIEKEIEAYDRNKFSIARKLSELEKAVIDCYKLEIKAGENHIPFNTVIDKIKSELPGSKDKCDTLLRIRNAVYHNQFPVREDAIQNTEGGRIAEKMKAISENYITEIMREIGNV